MGPKKKTPWLTYGLLVILDILVKMLVAFFYSKFALRDLGVCPELFVVIFGPKSPYTQLVVC